MKPGCLFLLSLSLALAGSGSCLIGSKTLGGQMEKKVVSVCVATYKRAELLKKLLDALVSQKTDGRFLIEVIVVDNDPEQSARSVVEQFQNSLSIRYGSEPRKGLSFVRNKTLELASGDFLAFIDDDEYPIDVWLLTYFSVLDRRKDVVVGQGPVIPYYTKDTKEWIIRGGFFDRPQPEDGTIQSEGKTNNAFVRRDFLVSNGISGFDMMYNLTGGEDTDFFRRIMVAGGKILWVSDAVVYEIVPDQRANMKWLLLRSLRTGGTHFKIQKENRWLGVNASIALMRLMISVVFLLGSLFVLPLSKVQSFRFLRKSVNNLGQFLSFFGFVYNEYA